MPALIHCWWEYILKCETELQASLLDRTWQWNPVVQCFNTHAECTTFILHEIKWTGIFLQKKYKFSYFPSWSWLAKSVMKSTENIQVKQLYKIQTYIISEIWTTEVRVVLKDLPAKDTTYFGVITMTISQKCKICCFFHVIFMEL